MVNKCSHICNQAYFVDFQPGLGRDLWEPRGHPAGRGSIIHTAAHVGTTSCNTSIQCKYQKTHVLLRQVKKEKNLNLIYILQGNYLLDSYIDH